MQKVSPLTGDPAVQRGHRLTGLGVPSRTALATCHEPLGDRQGVGRAADMTRVFDDPTVGQRGGDRDAHIDADGLARGGQ